MSAFATCAPRYHAAGANVIPIIPETKKPFVAWSLWQSRRQTTAEVSQLTEQYPNADIALILWGFCDIETDGPAGEQALRDLRLSLPPTAIFRSPRGYHRLYQCNKPVQTWKASDLEVRGIRHYSVVPMSPGREWQTMGELDDAVPLPEPWYGFLDREMQPPLAELERSGVPEGLRNTTLTALVGRWITQGMDRPTMVAKARRFARRCPSGAHPFTEQEAVAVVDSVIQSRTSTRSPEREAVMLAMTKGVSPIAQHVLVGLTALHGERGARSSDFDGPHRLVAKYARTSPMSVRKAYAELARAGLIKYRLRSLDSERQVTSVELTFLTPDP